MLNGIDKKRCGHIAPNDLSDWFRKYDVKIQGKNLMKMFPDGAIKMQYELIAEKYFELFFDQTQKEIKDKFITLARK